MNLPFFPLKLVVFPGEELNLHIFEPRYKELLKDVEQGDLTFGVCTYLDQLSGYGTEVKLDTIYTRYEDGRMDIKTTGKRVFKIESFENPAAGKSYAAGAVEWLEDDLRVADFLHHEYLLYLREILHLIGYETDFDSAEIDSFSFSHKIGLKLEEELELIKIPSEAKRTEFLLNHLKRIIPALKAGEHAKEKIKQNGQFKHLDPLDF
ncbi:LON peptidase substrate-binding domain-containing protein [Algoriphagus sp. D3-2-R+10]|uniref:LON peptidase substrate-binding domain-containing protein n=1 Tax=Algoriphagus aurantiacus TaxID=3103948 RepID=UPI002B3E677E|nr:LON peptidase substrate-binding domain-containing protein [Algoriphagus sp. D3-2-R+10]MEB2776907.1 LON peptidase substrate-binding domain-containing protein [Algoriphagus sp. D3-2-R+10]